MSAKPARRCARWACPRAALLMLGVRDGEVPASGPFFDQVVDAIAFLTWMRDLNAICAPPADTPAGAIAAQIARQTGITLLPYGPAATDLPLHPIAKANALAAHTHVGWGPPPSPWPWHAG